MRVWLCGLLSVAADTIENQIDLLLDLHMSVAILLKICVFSADIICNTFDVVDGIDKTTNTTEPIFNSILLRIYNSLCQFLSF